MHLMNNSQSANPANSATQSPLPPRLAAYFIDYHRFHTTKGNQNCHYIGLTMIVISALGLLSHLVIGSPGDGAFFRWDGGTILMTAGCLWYLFLDWKLALPFSLVLVGLYFLGRATPLSALWALQTVGWIFQFIGHFYYEKKSPAFLSNITHVLIGPLWIFAKMIGYAR